jgi:hypothetical protein
MRISLPRCAVQVLLGMYAFSSALLPAHAQPRGPVDQDLKQRDTPQCGSTKDATPSGLAVVLASGQHRGIYRRDQYLQALNNPFISGVAPQINWRDIEPVQGKPDWSKLDELVVAAESSNKWVHLAIFPGFFSPAWALEGAQTWHHGEAADAVGPRLSQPLVRIRAASRG